MHTCVCMTHLVLDELLPAEAGVDAHDEHQVDDGQQVLDLGERGGGVEHHAGLAAQVLDLQQAKGSRQAKGSSQQRS